LFGFANAVGGVLIFGFGELRVDQYGLPLDAAHGRRHGLPILGTSPEFTAFGGGADDVIHIGTILKVARLQQPALLNSPEPGNSPKKVYTFKPIDLTVELFADEMETKKASINLPEDKFEF
jgi:hypothetical protein